MLFCCQVRDPISVKININHKLARHFLMLFYKGNTDATGSFWYISGYFFKELFIGRKLYFSMRGRGVICHRIGASFLGQWRGASPCGASALINGVGWEGESCCGGWWHPTKGNPVLWHNFILLHPFLSYLSNLFYLSNSNSAWISFSADKGLS